MAADREEAAVGIRVFANSLPGFQAILKHRRGQGRSWAAGTMHTTGPCAPAMPSPTLPAAAAAPRATAQVCGFQGQRG